jgi:hypothetical protein
MDLVPNHTHDAIRREPFLTRCAVQTVIDNFYDCPRAVLQQSIIHKNHFRT